MEKITRYIKIFTLAGAILGTLNAANEISTQSETVIQEKKSRITKVERRDLKFMFQEEKLARDVYSALGEIWEHHSFFKIQKAEQSHMNALKRLMKRYRVRIPIDENSVGQFADKNLQKRYDRLIDKGSASLKAALKVAIFIEKTDIDDLKKRRKRTHRYIRRTYDRLLHESRRHLKRFKQALKKIEDGGGNDNAP